MSHSIEISSSPITHSEITLETLQEWLASYICDLLNLTPDEIDLELPFESYGLDSAAAVAMTGDLEDWLTVELDPTLVYDYPTISALSSHLAETLAIHTR